MGGGTWATFSDKRVKKNIAPFVDGLEVALKLNPVTFEYNSKSGYSDTTSNFVGFIAQDVENIAPYMVNKYNDSEGASKLHDKRQFDESALPKILLNAIKEQQAMIDELKDKLDNQSKINNDLKSEIETIKLMLDRVEK